MTSSTPVLTRTVTPPRGRIPDRGSGPDPRSRRSADTSPGPISCQVTRDLNDQWERLCAGLESGPDVGSCLDAWHRSPAATLGPVSTLDDLLCLIRLGPVEANAVLTQLVAQAQAGDTIACRVVVQAMLPKLVLLARSRHQPLTPFEEMLATAIGLLWERVVTGPLNRTGRIQANLALDTLRGLCRSRFDDDPRTVSVPSFGDADQQERGAGSGGVLRTPLGAGRLTWWEEPHSPDDELTVVLDRAEDLGVVTRQEALLLIRVYRYGETDALAAELGITTHGIRMRCSRVRARLQDAAPRLPSNGRRRHRSSIRTTD